MANIDIARALKDKQYFNSLTEDQKAMVRRANPSGESSLDDRDLDSVSGGLGGGEQTEATTTTTDGTCTCPASDIQPVGNCSCTCSSDAS
jgi:mersacidin/lichenicidin family type 2 lantibiotic